MIYDVIIVGGGPGGLSAALALGRARKRVLLCDAGPRRNAAAVHIHNVVTRDGTPPETFRQIGRDELATYPNVELRSEHVASIAGARDAFDVVVGEHTVRARRVLLCTGMIDEVPQIDGFRELWGRAIFQCPYCHGWEVKDRRWGYLVREPHVSHLAPFVLQLRGWTRDVQVFLQTAFDVPESIRASLAAAGVTLHASPVSRLVVGGSGLDAVVLADGSRVPCDVLYAHPPQRQVDLVTGLGLALDEDGFVAVDPMRRETSVPGIYAAGDLTTRMQGASLASGSAVHAAAMLNLDVTMSLLASGEL